MSIRIPLILQVFTLLPAGASAARMIELWQQSPVADSAFEIAIHANPTVFLVHILTASLFAALAAFQVAPRFRAGRRKLHRRLGYASGLSGMGMALSGIWLVAAFPVAEGALLSTQIIRGVFGVVLGWLLLDGLRAAMQREIARHQRQMARAYGLGVVSTTTNALLFGVWAAATGDLSPLSFTVLMTLGWAGSLVGADLWLRRTKKRQSRGSSLSSSPSSSPDGRLKKLSASL